MTAARPSARPHRGGRGVDEPTLLRRALTSERPAQTQVLDADDRGLWRRMERVEVLAALARPQRAAPNVGEGVPVRRPAELIIGGHARVDRRWVLWFRVGDGPLEIWPPAPAQARDLRLRLEGDALIATWSAGAAAPATMAGGEALFDADAQSGATVTVRLHPPSDTADADAWARDLERRLEPFRPVHVRYRVVAI